MPKEKDIYELFKPQLTPKQMLEHGVFGGSYFKDKEMNYIKGHDVEAIDTVGSGDCFVGALSFSLLKDKSLKESCEFANRSAAISVTRKGAAASMPTIDEVES